VGFETELVERMSIALRAAAERITGSGWVGFVEACQ